MTCSVESAPVKSSSVRYTAFHRPLDEPPHVGPDRQPRRCGPCLQVHSGDQAREFSLEFQLDGGADRHSGKVPEPHPRASSPNADSGVS